MERIFRFFGKEYKDINQAALLLGIFAFLSQLLGLFRDRFIAHSIGPSPLLDTYYAAFRIPDLIFISIASLASITVLIPFIAQKMKGNEVTPESRKFIDDVFSVFLLVLIGVCLIVFLFMPSLVKLIVPGFPPVMQAGTVHLSRIMLLSPILLGLSNLFGSITQLFRKFFIYSLSPIFYNLGIIIGIWLFYPIVGISGLAWGVVLGALMHFLIQVFASSRLSFPPRISLKINMQDIRRVVSVSLPRTIGLSINNITLIVMISFASFLSSGSISIFNFSMNIQSVPLGIIGLSYAVAAFPTLTRSYSAGKMEDFKKQLRSAARQIVFWSLPVTFLFIVLRAQIVRVVLGSGSFSWDDTRLVAASLAVFSISVMSQGLIALFARSYYAVGNTKRPLVVNFVSSVFIILFVWVFLTIFKQSEFLQNWIEVMFKVSGIPGTEVLMLPLAYSLGTIINSIILWIFIKKDFMHGEHFIFKTFFQSLCASFFVAVVSYLGLNALSGVFGTTTFWGVFLQGFLAGIFGILAGALVLYVFRSEEFFALIKTLKSRFWKTSVISSGEERL